MFAVAALTLAIACAPPSIDHAARLLSPAMVAVHVERESSDVVRPGFFVSGSGVAVAVVPEVDEVVLELASGERRVGRVVVRDDDGLALVELKKLAKDAAGFPSLGLGSGAPPSSSDWLLGIGLVDGKFEPSVGGLRKTEGPTWRLDLPLDPGAPILVDDRVIAVVVERHGRTACSAVPVERVLSLVKRMP